MFSVIN